MRINTLLILVFLVCFQSNSAFGGVLPDKVFCVQSATDYYPKSLKDVPIMVDTFANPAVRETLKFGYAMVMDASYVDECMGIVETMVLKEVANFVSQYIAQNSMQDTNVINQLMMVYSQIQKIKQQYNYTAADEVVSSLERVRSEKFASSESGSSPSKPVKSSSPNYQANKTKRHSVQTGSGYLPQPEGRQAPPPKEYGGKQPSQNVYVDPATPKKNDSSFKDGKDEFKFDRSLESTLQKSSKEYLENAKNSAAEPVGVIKRKKEPEEGTVEPSRSQAAGPLKINCRETSIAACPIKLKQEKKSKKGESKTNKLPAKKYASCLTRIRVPNSYDWERKKYPFGRFKIKNICSHQVHYGFCSSRAAGINARTVCGAQGSSDDKYYANGGELAPGEIKQYRKHSKSLVWEFSACKTREDFRFLGERNTGKEYGCVK